MTRLEKANNYIKENIHKVNIRPLYHFTPELGWLNDPNGFSYYKGKYHLFYQFYPYDIKWNDMHWGHATSNDLIKWEYEPVALANDTIADANGCFSGSAIEKDGKLYLMYTGNINPNMGYEPNWDEMIQHQCLAVSEDGINFFKHKNNPIISEFDLPKGYKRADFRDPKVIEKDGIYYVVLVAKNEQGRGEVLLYKSLDLIKWDYVSAIYQTKFEENIMLECPDLFTLDEKDILILSVMPCDPIYEKEIGNITEYIVGTLNYSTGEYTIEHKDIIDYGNSFYAPQSMKNLENKRIMIGWMKKWINKNLNPPEDLEWNGMMSIPREVKLKDNKLMQSPVASVKNYMSSKEKINAPDLEKELIFDTKEKNIFNFSCSLNTVLEDTITFNLFKTKNKAIKIKINLKNNTVIYTSDFDDMHEIYSINTKLLKENQLILDVYIDKYSIELFINHGEKVFSFTSFSDDKGNEFSLSSEKKAVINHAEINHINV